MSEINAISVGSLLPYSTSCTESEAEPKNDNSGVFIEDPVQPLSGSQDMFFHGLSGLLR